MRRIGQLRRDYDFLIEREMNFLLGRSAVSVRYSTLGEVKFSGAVKGLQWLKTPFEQIPHGVFSFIYLADASHTLPEAVPSFAGLKTSTAMT